MKLIAVAVGASFVPISAVAMGLGIETQQFDRTWIDTAKDWQSGIGATLGLIAILLGALFNAGLNRRRDKALRREESQAIATALAAEVEANIIILKNMEKKAVSLVKRSKISTQDVYEYRYWVMRPPMKDTFRSVGEQIGLLPITLVKRVVAFYVMLETGNERFVDVETKNMEKTKNQDVEDLGYTVDRTRLHFNSQLVRLYVETGDNVLSLLEDFSRVEPTYLERLCSFCKFGGETK